MKNWKLTVSYFILLYPVNETDETDDVLAYDALTNDIDQIRDFCVNLAMLRRF